MTYSIAAVSKIRLAVVCLRTDSVPMSCRDTEGTGVLDRAGCVGGIIPSIYLFISLYMVYLTALPLSQTI